MPSLTVVAVALLTFLGPSDGFSAPARWLWSAACHKVAERAGKVDASFRAANLPDASVVSAEERRFPLVWEVLLHTRERGGFELEEAF
eukprot:3142837-Rhodomonas_salina.1